VVEVGKLLASDAALEISETGRIAWVAQAERRFSTIC